ncbi:MAG: biotin/lipoyl-containing protein [Planctomycetota bacterium]
MAREVVLPKLGQTMQEGTVVNIRFEAGNCVTAGDVLFDIETDKATLEIESETGGFVKAVLVEPGQTVRLVMRPWGQRAACLRKHCVTPKRRPVVCRSNLKSQHWGRWFH